MKSTISGYSPGVSVWGVFISLLIFAAGISLGWCIQYYTSDRDFKSLTTYAFIQGACGEDIPSCTGTIEVRDATTGKKTHFEVSHGAIFKRNAVGFYSRNPVLLEDIDDRWIFTGSEP